MKAETIKRIVKNSLPQMMRDDGQDVAILATVMVGEKARQHTGTGKPLVAYFATEGSSISAFYYDALELYWKWEEEMQAGLKKHGLYMEHKNLAEHLIFQI